MENGSEQLESAGTAQVESSEPPFLRGWGGIIAFVLGGGIAIVLLRVLAALFGYIDAAVSAAGVSVQLRVIALYWLQTAIVIAWFWTSFFGDRSASTALEGLRAGRGDWRLVMRLAVGIGVLGVFAGVMFARPSGLADSYYQYADAARWSRLIFVAGAVGALWFARRTGLLDGRKGTYASPS